MNRTSGSGLAALIASTMGKTFRRCRANSVPDLSGRGDRWCLSLETGREAAPTGRCSNLRTHSRDRDFSSHKSVAHHASAKERLGRYPPESGPIMLTLSFVVHDPKQTFGLRWPAMLPNRFG